ncbi:MAG: 50S ribosomal protein L25 [Chitinophagales bacterium]|nr:50S ribosomal protein L25 [Chitinophagales bacterium]
METVSIAAQPRTELGKKAAKALRKQGLVPCNLYGGKETINFSAPYTSLQPIVFTPAFKIAEIELNGKKIKAITKELQFDPVKDTVKHVDFQELVDDIKVKVEVPLKLSGVPAEVAMGAKLEQTMRKLKIFALPKHLPEVIVVEVGDLTVGQNKRIKDIQIEGITLLHSASIPVARLTSSRASKEAAAAAAASTGKK